MSNSLENTFPIREALKQYSCNTLRLYSLSHHYRSPLIFSKTRLEKFEILNTEFASLIAMDDIAADSSNARTESVIMKKFRMCIEDDFDTVGAFRILKSVVEAQIHLSDLRLNDKYTWSALLGTL